MVKRARRLEVQGNKLLAESKKVREHLRKLEEAKEVCAHPHLIDRPLASRALALSVLS